MKKTIQIQLNRKTVAVFRSAKEAIPAPSDPTMSTVTITRTSGRKTARIV